MHLSLNGTLRLSFALGLAGSVIIMKSVSLNRFQLNEKKELIRFFISPVFSVTAWNNCSKVNSSDLLNSIKRSLIVLPFLFGMYFFC